MVNAKEIVSLAKAGDLDGLVSAMKLLVISKDNDSESLISTKTALNLCPNLLKSCQSETSLNNLYEVFRSLLDKFPSLNAQENVAFSLVKVQIAMGDIQGAVGTALGISEPRIRSFSAVLEACSQLKRPCLAFDIMDAIAERDLKLTEKEVSYIFQSDMTAEDMDKFLQRISEDFDEPFHQSTFDSPKNIQSVSFVDNVLIPSHDGDSICPETGIKLEKIPLDEKQLDELILLSRRLAIEAGCCSEEEFESIIVTQMNNNLPDVVLDGANIAHVNQNFSEGYFRFDQISDIQTHFADKECLIVLHAKWLSPDKDLRLFSSEPGEGEGEEKKVKKRRKKPALPPLGDQPSLVEARKPPIDTHDDHDETVSVGLQETSALSLPQRPVPMDLIEKWRKEKILFQVPHKQNDDWFWLHICCLAIRGGKKDLLLVSNDLMRDHLWRMHNPKSFSRFVKNHVCRYTIKFGEDGINHYDFQYPPNHSICMHRHERVDGSVIWHIPYRVAENGDEEKIRWIVLKL
jgi:hypothetical protein